MRRVSSLCHVGLAVVMAVCIPAQPPVVLAKDPVPRAADERPSSTIRCAVIGGMIDTGFWPQLCERYTEATGHEVEVVSSGPKHIIAEAFIAGQADLITMHASDTIINLVADGYGENPQPWARNDLLLVGPPADPAGVRGMNDAVDALRKIVSNGHRLLLHRSQGAQEVLLDLAHAGRLKLEPDQVISHPVDEDRALLEQAAQHGAYTLVGRIPFRNGKIADGGMQVMVEGDPRLRRPYVVVTAPPTPENRNRMEAARELAAFLRDEQTQSWIAQFGRGELDDRPLFFPVHVPNSQ